MSDTYDHAGALRSGWATPSEIHNAADRIDTLTADLAAMTADRDRLRDTMQQVKLEMLAEDGEVPDTNDDWTMLHGWIAQFDTALAAREQQAGAKGG